MPERDPYTPGELLWCALLLAAALCHALYAAVVYFQGDSAQALQASGVGLMLLGGCAEPRRYLQDILRWSWWLAPRHGRETWLTQLAAAGGLLLWLGGLAWANLPAGA